MKRSVLVKAILILFALSLLLASLASCTESYADYVETVTAWELSDDGSILYRNEEPFTRVTLPANVAFSPVAEYEYYDTVVLPGCGEVILSSYAKDGDVVWTVPEDYYDASEITLYANETGTERLTDFLGKKSATPLLLCDTYYTSYASADADLLTTLDERRTNGTAQLTVDVARLADASCYPLYAYDEQLVLRYTYGAFYLYEDAYYFLNYTALDNTHFDSDGNFSYRSGSVALTALDSAESKQLEAMLTDAQYSYTYGYEMPDGEGSGIVSGLAVGYLVLAVIAIALALLAPIPFIVMGFAFPHSEKRGRPRYWYAVAGAAVVWLVASAVLIVLVLL